MVIAIPFKSCRRAVWSLQFFIPVPRLIILHGTRLSVVFASYLLVIGEALFRFVHHDLLENPLLAVRRPPACKLLILDVVLSLYEQRRQGDALKQLHLFLLNGGTILLCPFIHLYLTRSFLGIKRDWIGPAASLPCL